MSTNNSDIFVDHESIVSTPKKPILDLSSLLFQTDSSLRKEFWMILFRADAIFASSISKFGK